MKNKNILELCLSPDAGGLELYMMKLSFYLSTKTKVVSVINESGKLKEFYKNSEYKYETIKKNSTLLSFVTAKKLAKIVDENEIDILHLHWTKDLPVGVLTKIFAKRKIKLVQSRHMTMTRFKDDFYHRFLYKNIDLMVAVTKQVKAQIEKFIPADIRPIVQNIYIGAQTPTLITQEKKKSLEKEYALGDSFVVGIVGRIEKGKGQYLVIDAAYKLTQKGFDIKVLVVGHAMDENYLSELKSNIVIKNMSENVIFTGFTTEVQSLMQVCDTLVLATQKETFGLVLIEAMASGVAVIASDSGGPLEIIENEKSGLLFKGDDSDDLSEKIETLFDVERKEKMALLGKERAQKMFNSQKQYEELYSSLLV